MQSFSVILLLALGCFTAFAVADIYLVGDLETKAVWRVSLDGSVATKLDLSSAIDATSVFVSKTLNRGFAATINGASQITGLISFEADGTDEQTLTFGSDVEFSGIYSVNVAGNALYFYDVVNNTIFKASLTGSLTTPTITAVGSVELLGLPLVGGAVSSITVTGTKVVITTALISYQMDLTTGLVAAASLFTTVTAGVDVTFAANGKIFIGIGSVVVQYNADGTGKVNLTPTFGTINFIGDVAIDASGAASTTTILVADSANALWSVDVSTNIKVAIVTNVSTREAGGVTKPRSGGSVTGDDNDISDSASSDSPASKLSSFLF
jgi:hypothetical protein